MAATNVDVNLASNSMYLTTPVYQVNNDIVFGLMTPPLGPDATDTIFTVTEEYADRLDLVANLMYGNPLLYWVIADANNLVDIQVGVPVGTQLRVPSKSRLTALKISTT